MYAIVETGGKQYRVEHGSLVQVERLPGDVGGRVELSDVRLVHGDKGVLVGQPLVKGAKVTAEIIDQDSIDHGLQETTAEELSTHEGPSSGFHEIADHGYRNSLSKDSYGDE